MSIFLILILSALQQISHLLPQNTTGQKFTNFYQFMGDLYNNSHSLSDFAMTFQAVFCPQQPICSSSGVLDRKDIIDALTSSLVIDGKIVQPDELSTLVGLCCLPCSCEGTCLDNNKCCLTKHVNDYESRNVPSTPGIRSECIAATSKSYLMKSKLGNKYSRYSMITQCYKDMENNVTTKKCQQPNSIVPDETLPVTSVRTNRTYWNKYCALCNNDSEETLQWSATIYYRRDLVYFASKRVLYQKQNFEYFFEQAMEADGFIYSKPNGVENSRCVRKEQLRQTELNTSSSEVNRFIQMVCEQFHSPVYSRSIKSSAYKNVFCYLYGHDFTFTESNMIPDCIKNNFRDSYSKMTALLNYEHIGHDTRNLVHVEVRLDLPKCSCKSIFDSTKVICRPVYCPPGEDFIGCECRPFVYQFAGIPVALKLKVRHVRGLDMPDSVIECREVGVALTKALQKKYRQIKVKMMAVFARNISTSNNYQVYIAIARTLHGFDTKETLKELADHLEGPSFLEFTAIHNKMLVEISNRIELWRESDIFHAKYIDDNTEFEQIYQDNQVLNSLGQMGLFQELSPLLFCKQIQLDQSEFTETGAIVHVNTSSAQYQTVNYYHPTMTTIRLCVNEFVNVQNLSSGTSRISVITVLSMFLSYLLLYILNKP